MWLRADVQFHAVSICRSKHSPIKVWWLCSGASGHIFQMQNLRHSFTSLVLIPVHGEWSCQIPDSGSIFASVLVARKSQWGRVESQKNAQTWFAQDLTSSDSSQTLAKGIRAIFSTNAKSFSSNNPSLLQESLRLTGTTKAWGSAQLRQG